MIVEKHGETPVGGGVRYLVFCCFEVIDTAIDAVNFIQMACMGVIFAFLVVKSIPILVDDIRILLALINAEEGDGGDTFFFDVEEFVSIGIHCLAGISFGNGEYHTPVCILIVLQYNMLQKLLLVFAMITKNVNQSYGEGGGRYDNQCGQQDI